MKFITLNLRATADRWRERFPMVVDMLHAEQPDFVGFQEVHLKVQQAHLIQGALNYLYPDDPYKLRIAEDSYKPPILANAILSRYPIIEHERTELPLGNRIAQRIQIEKDGKTLTIANTHLHHKPSRDESIRLPQMTALLDWLDSKSNDGCVVVGDFNARPDSETILYAKNSLTSAYEAANNSEPASTFPTPLIQEDYAPRAIDYILYTGHSLNTHSARIIADTPHPRDDRLYPSDHYGVCAEIEFI